MVKEINGLKIEIDSIRQESRYNILSFDEERFNKSQFNALSKQHNKLGFLNCKIKYKDDKVEVRYETTNLISLNEYFDQNNMLTEREFIGILKTICQSVKSCSDYIYFNKENFLLDGDLIYIDTKDRSIYIMYIPIRDQVTKDVILDLKDLVKDWINNRLKFKSGERNFTQGILEELRESSLDIDTFFKFLSYSSDKDVSVNKIDHNVGINKIHIHNSVDDNSAIDNQQSNNNSTYNSQVNNEEIYSKQPESNNAKKPRGIFAGLFGSKKKEKKEIKNKPNFNKRNIISENAYDDSYDTEILGVSVSLKSGYLVGNTQGNREEIQITKDDFVIGRLRESVDYDIANRAVGKIHAKFLIKEDKFYIVDLESKNGTFLNNIRLNPNTMYEVINGSKITFANSHYTFKIVG